MSEDSPTLPPALMLSPGQRIGGYEIQEYLRDGGWGRLYAAVRETNRERFAFKTIRPDFAERLAFRKRFKEEQSALKRLNEHPNLRPATDWNSNGDEGLLWLAVPWIDGPTLHGLLSKGLLEPKRAAGLLAQAAEGLHAVHTRAKRVHRDLHPGNLMIESGDHLRVIDFGLAKRFEHSSGSPFQPHHGKWNSPEATKGSELTPQADIYSLGLVLAYALTGSEPDDNAPVFPDNVEVPADLRSVIERATRHDPEARFASAEAMAIALHAAVRPLAPRPPATPPARRPSPPPAPAEARRTGVVTGLVLCAAAIAAVGAFLLADPLLGSDPPPNIHIHAAQASIEAPPPWTRARVPAADRRLGLEQAVHGPAGTVLIGHVARSQLPLPTRNHAAYDVALPAGKAVRLDDAKALDAWRVFAFHVGDRYLAIVCRQANGATTKSIDRACGQIASSAVLEQRPTAIPYPSASLRRRVARALHSYAAARRAATEQIEAAATHGAVASAATQAAQASWKASQLLGVAELRPLRKALGQAGGGWHDAAEAARKGKGYHEAGEEVKEAEQRIEERRRALVRLGYRA
jgi:hypothetical protein